MQKECFKCKETKPIDAFYKHPQMADGHLGKCKECAKRDVKAHYERIGGNAKYERERFQRPERKASVAKCMRAMRAREPIKFKAWGAVSYAVRTGKLIKQPCKLCASTVRVQAHHHDYTKPLDVEWLCFKCHREHAHGQTIRSNQ
jgi:hypothetical protein